MLCEVAEKRNIKGLTYVTTTLRPIGNGARRYAAQFLVDTGASDSMAPASAMKKIHVKKAGKMSYELADGTVREYSFGLVTIEFMGEITAGRVVFGPDDSEPILGVTALESVGILVDAAHKTLKRLPAIPLK